MLLIQFTIKYKSLVHYSFCFKNDFRDQDMNHFTSIFLTVLQAVVNIFGFIVETKQSYVSMRAVSLAAWFLPIIKKRRKKLKPCKGCGGEQKESCFSSHLKGDRNETLLQIYIFFLQKKRHNKAKIIKHLVNSKASLLGVTHFEMKSNFYSDWILVFPRHECFSFRTLK